MLLSVSVPAADLRKEPSCTRTAVHDDLRESQLLANELFRPLRYEQGWYYGEAIEQPYFTCKGWSGYLGWVKENELVNAKMTDRQNSVVISREAIVALEPGRPNGEVITLPLGSRVRVSSGRHSDLGFSQVMLHSGQLGWVRTDSLRSVNDDDGRTDFLREGLIGEVVENAFRFVGIPYLWGGMNVSPAGGRAPEICSGVDCSALVCLSYRLCGISVPRNAHDQWMWAQAVEGDQVRVGDLLFMAKEEDPPLIRHVMMCTGFDSLIEASETGRSVSEITFREKFGLSFGELNKAGLKIEGRRIYRGRITTGFKTEKFLPPIPSRGGLL